MNKWLVKNLGDALLAYPQQERIESRFLADYQARGEPKGMALFLRHESEGRLQCELKLYFSPAAHDVAQMLGARPCAKPSVDDLALLRGNF